MKGHETARLDHCMKCGSTTMRNNVYFCKGQNIRVYLECAECGSYVARYTLLRYTSDEPYESLLQKMRFTRVDSGREALRMVEAYDSDVQEEFKRVRELIKEHEDQRRMEQIIEEDFPEGFGQP
jgi:hypothetical protein